MQETSNSENVSTKLQRIAELAEQDVTMVLVTLAHHIDVEFLKDAFRRTRKDGAPGVDGRTATEYEERLDENLHSLRYILFARQIRPKSRFPEAIGP